MDNHKYMLISCAVLARECYQCASVSKNTIDVKILQQGLHDIGEEKMSAALQKEIDTIDVDEYEAVLLVYGLCNNGIRNLRARIPMVIPRAHDCITLLMGSREKYTTFFNEHPGTFYRSVGWIERSVHNLDNPDSTTRRMGMASREEYVKMYGEENADYLMETLGDHLKNYNTMAFIDTGLPDMEPHRRQAREMADENGWEFIDIKGNNRLIVNLMDGQWDPSEYLIIPPGQTIDPSYDDTIVKTR